MIEELSEAIEEGPGSPARATIFTGARGAGKTVMLNAVEDRAREQGWIVVSETATRGFVQRIVREHLPGLLRQFDPQAVKRRLTGFTAPLGASGVSWSAIEAHVAEAGLRSQIELLTTLLADNGSGLLVSLDELHRDQIPELRQLATVVQHAFRENRELVFVGAGLDSAVSDVLNDDVLTFLRRAERHHLGPVDRDDVARAIREPVELNGRRIADEALEAMVDTTQGYPFLIQLVGHRAWRRHPADADISVDDAHEGAAEARRRLGALVHAPALAQASEIDKSFLLAMAKDDGPTRMADLQARLGVDANYASQYRLRLIAADLIEPAGYGRVAFALPYLRDYLRDHVASDV
ncbi:MAG TPA: AAA family ATPase [Acidimicrobiales bacterium]|nr:AAA family ATPase [Acidimicrobiales bacterium]